MNLQESGILEGSDYYLYTPSLQATKAFFYPLIVGHSYYSNHYNLSRNSFDSFLIMQIKKGKCYIEVDGKTYTASKDQIVIIDCYKPHSYYTDSGWEAEWIHFDGPLAREFYNAVQGSIGIVVTLLDKYKFENSLHKIYTQFRNNAAVKEVLLNLAITELLTQILLSKDSVSKQTLSIDVIEELAAYINEHFQEELPLEQLALRASLSPYHFARLFKKHIGLTPHDYLIATRINFAKYLLTSTNMSVKEICFRSGFSSETSFCTTFKKREKVTPSSFREQVLL